VLVLATLPLLPVLASDVREPPNFTPAVSNWRYSFSS
jgi:hypothetical protein